MLSPLKSTEMPAVPVVWLTSVMVQLAAPLESVVPVQLCVAPPDPKLNVTVLPATSLAAEGSLDVSTPERVADCPLVTEVAPV